MRQVGRAAGSAQRCVIDSRDEPGHQQVASSSFRVEWTQTGRLPSAWACEPPVQHDRVQPAVRPLVDGCRGSADQMIRCRMASDRSTMGHVNQELCLNHFLRWICLIGLCVLTHRAYADCSQRVVTFDGYALWADLQGTGSVTVAFEAGGGNDSQVWSALADKVRKAGYQTLVYDRSGLGRSRLYREQYAVEDEVKGFRGLLDQCHVQHPIVLVAHSYGGVISLLTAATDKRVVGLLLLDALVPLATPPAEIEAVFATFRPQYDEIRKQAPDLAKAIIPMMEAFPETVKKLDQLRLPAGLPILDIVAENTVTYTENTAKYWNEAHRRFVKADRARTLQIAKGSSHKVYQDKPDLVLQSILLLLKKRPFVRTD